MRAEKPGEHFRISQMGKDKIFVVYDRNVEKYAAEIADGHPMFAITADEEHKTIDTVMDICRWLLSEGADRDAFVYAVGGGVTTDLAGFAASIYKRGVRYANFPTTLLSQVDAGVGGKTGCNVDGFKNMIGVTRFPRFTRILPQTLETLPDRELRSGAAELLKTFIIKNRRHSYEKAVEVLSRPGIDVWELGPLVEEAAAVKKEIVGKDPYEENIRRYLNLGHTYAHAIEWYQHTHGEASPLSHGEAVAAGLIQAARISERLGVCKPGLARKLADDFTACSLPTELPVDASLLEEALWKDKKAENGRIHFVLIEKIGKVTIKDLDDLHKYSE